uniref:Uncharacterized protein n=1 Tax=Knipowitschia caucasica TaxID=637954 RepID=A0AAV2J3H9_KNICA
MSPSPIKSSTQQSSVSRDSAASGVSPTQTRRTRCLILSCSNDGARSCRSGRTPAPAFRGRLDVPETRSAEDT